MRRNDERSWNQAAGRRFLGVVKVRNKEDRIRNESITKKLQIYSIKDKLDETTIKWRGYILKMDELRLPKVIISCKATGVKLQGRSLKKFLRHLHILRSEPCLQKKKRRK
jgi:hypothetical protein